MTHIINPVYYQDFILSGKPEFTLKSLKTGNEEIFVVRRAKYELNYWVNNRLRELIGYIKLVDGSYESIMVFEQKTRDITVYQADQMKIFGWLWINLMKGVHNPLLKDIQLINHTSRCGHCHRPLTHPESIPIGIGPDCFKKLGLVHKPLITLP